MNLNDLIPTPNSKQIAAVSHKVFGRSINVESLTKEKAQSLRETFAARLGKLESKLGANIANNPTYLENKLFLETLDTYLGEETETDYDSMSTTQLRKVYARLEDENDHSEAALLLATVYGTDAQKEEVEAIKARHRQNGSIEHEDQKARDAISSELYPELKQGVTESEAKADPDVVEKFADVSDSQRSYYIMKWAKKNGIDGDDAMIMAGYKRGDYMGSGSSMWDYDPQRITESVIVEGEMEAAEQVMASKNMVDKIQKMVEDLGGMLNEDLPPLTDSIRDNMDSAMADGFNLAMTDALSSALESMRGTREQVDAAARILTGEAAPEMMGDPVEAPVEEPEMEPTTDMDMEAPAEEEDFAAADAAQDGEEELGRARR